MRIFAISDLHLPARRKPMDIFGPHWENHFERIRDSWLSQVTEEDVVLLPGDFTWAMRLDEAMEDIGKVGVLPGRKILLRGNHDYWWGGIGQVRRALPEGMYALQNDAMEMEGIVFAGSRGWTLPGSEAATGEDLKIYQRERLRLEMSLRGARAKSQTAPLIALMHYPPLFETLPGFSDLLEKYAVDHCVYGHLHGNGACGAFRGEKNGVKYHFASCDKVDFRLLQVASYAQ